MAVLRYGGPWLWRARAVTNTAMRHRFSDYAHKNELSAYPPMEDGTFTFTSLRSNLQCTHNHNTLIRRRFQVRSQSARLLVRGFLPSSLPYYSFPPLTSPSLPSPPLVLSLLSSPLSFLPHTSFPFSSHHPNPAMGSGSAGSSQRSTWRSPSHKRILEIF